MDTAEGAAMMALTALKGSADLLTLLAEKGLLSPAEVSEFTDGLMLTLRRPEDHKHHDYFERLSVGVEGVVSPSFARAMQAARTNWKDG